MVYNMCGSKCDDCTLRRKAELFDPSALQIIAFIGGVPHRKGFAWECAIVDDGAEQFILAHAFKQKSDSGAVLDQRTERILAVDVIDLDFGVMFGVIEQKGLQCAHGQLLHGVGNRKHRVARLGHTHYALCGGSAVLF